MDPRRRRRHPWLALPALLAAVAADGSGPPSRPRDTGAPPSQRAALRQLLDERHALRRESARLAVEAAAARDDSIYLVVDATAGVAELRLHRIPLRTAKILDACGWPSAPASVGSVLELRPCRGSDVCVRLDSGARLGFRAPQADSTGSIWHRLVTDLTSAGDCRAAPLTKTLRVVVAESDLTWLQARLDSAVTVVTLSR